MKRPQSPPPSEDESELKRNRTVVAKPLVFPSETAEAQPKSGYFDFDTSRAQIPSFGSAHLPKSLQHHENYNDGVNLPTYVSSARTYADKQRNGIQEEHMKAQPISGHVRVALISLFLIAFDNSTRFSARCYVLGIGLLFRGDIRILGLPAFTHEIVNR